MSIFNLSQSVIDEYSQYIRSFLSISDDRVRAFVEDCLLKNQLLWPDALLQLNPSYEMASTIQDLVNQAKLYPLWERGTLLKIMTLHPWVIYGRGVLCLGKRD